MERTDRLVIVLEQEERKQLYYLYIQKSKIREGDEQTQSKDTDTQRIHQHHTRSAVVGSNVRIAHVGTFTLGPHTPQHDNVCGCQRQDERAGYIKIPETSGKIAMRHQQQIHFERANT
jgi:hypothetical protein